MVTQTQQALYTGFTVFLVYVQPEKAVIYVGLNNFSKFLASNIQTLFEVGVVVSGFEGQLDQSAEQTVVHEPEIGEIAAFRFLSFEGIPEEVVEQLVAHLIARHVGPRLNQLSQFDLNGIFLLGFNLDFLLKFRRQALSYTGHNFPINLFKLCSLVYFLTFIEDASLALPELLLKDEFISKEKLTGDDNVDETVFSSIDLIVLTYFLIDLKYFLADFIVQGLVLGFLTGFMSQNVPVKFLQHWQQLLPQLKQTLVDLRKGKDVHPKGRTIVDQLVQLTGTQTPGEVVVDDEADDLVLVKELALVGSEHIGTRLSFSDFFELIGQFGKLDEGGNFAGLHVDHLVVEGWLLPDLGGLL